MQKELFTPDPDVVDEQEQLTDYAVITRYPGDYEEIPLLEAQNAVNVARRVRTQVRKLLPNEAIST